MSTSFEESWAFPNEIKKALGATGYDINDTASNFSTGRPRLEAVFYEGDGSARKVIKRRTAMELISKRTGVPYTVVSRKPPAAACQPTARQAAPAARQAYTIDDAIAT